MSINFQELFKVCEATEKLPLGGFEFHSLVRETECGTVGCMIGNYNALVGRSMDCFANANAYCRHGDWEWFGITHREYHWMFDVCGEMGSVELLTDWHVVRNVTREQALARLRKFIYYKLHKQEMTYDEQYGVKESARRAEGNQNFAQRAKAEALADV